MASFAPEPATPTDNGIMESGDTVEVDKGGGGDGDSGDSEDGDSNVSGGKPLPASAVLRGDYFDTSIVDGETVYEREYRFTITHKKPQLKVLGVLVSVGADTLPLWNGRIELKNGVNRIRVTVRYADGKGKEMAVYREYTLYAELDEEGAADKETGALEIVTSLTGSAKSQPQVINDAELTFDAAVRGGTGGAQLRVVCGGVTLKGNGGSYRATIGEANRTVTVRMTATDSAGGDAEAVTVYYYIKFIPIATEDTAPRLKFINVTDGMTVAGAKFTLDIEPVDHAGGPLGYNDVAVRLNGKTVRMSWMSEYLSYALFLEGGANALDIRLTDHEGRFADCSYTITCRKLEDGDSLGAVTISVDATVLGLGYLIEPTEMEIFEGETGAHLVDRLLGANGFTYRHTGTPEDDFYLARVTRSGIGRGVDIPADLLEALAKDGYKMNSNRSDDSLGEMDYFKGSGWMYSKNGSFPGHGFADSVLKDGDAVKIRFTLAYGKDIGGHKATGSGETDNYGKIW
jgi:hypothetical protein